jgi:hypothetical protein
MMKILIFLSILSLTACSSKSVQKREVASELEITEINPNQRTALTKKNMLGLASEYNLDPYLYTKKINIESRVIPHSNPILTLNTRNAVIPQKILSSWLHEEFHWWADMNREKIEKAVADFRTMYPVLPQVGGARNEYSTYLHLVVCFLEYKAVSLYLGEVKAREMLLEFATVDAIYPWIYTQILNRTKEIENVVKDHKLLPEGLK